jgi:hypothetical protein
MTVLDRARAFVEILGPMIPDHRYPGASSLERTDILSYAYGLHRVSPIGGHSFDGTRQRRRRSLSTSSPRAGRARGAWAR